jgi:hypothetical protein
VRRLALSCGLAALALAGCGGEPNYSAEEFIDAANAQGAGLVLADPLETTREEVDLYALQFEGGPSSGTATPLDAHGGGTLTVAEDAEAGAAEYDRCEAAPALLCFRAGNVSLYFAGALDPADLRRVENAIRALGTEG